MRTEYLAAIAVTAVAGMVGSAVYSVRTSDNCPQPSAASVSALFAPCQTYAAGSGPTITTDEAMDIGLAPLSPRPASAPAQQPAPTPAQIVGDEFQSLAHEHATTGAANSKQEH
jgi:hypothetical protein